MSTVRSVPLELTVGRVFREVESLWHTHTYSITQSWWELRCDIIQRDFTPCNQLVMTSEFKPGDLAVAGLYYVIIVEGPYEKTWLGAYGETKRCLAYDVLFNSQLLTGIHSAYLSKPKFN